MAKRTLSDWASIAEIVGAAAVVASLLYVGYEINRNTEVSLATNRQAIASRAQDLALYSAETNIHRLLFDPSGDDIELTETEKNYLTAYIGGLLRTTEEAYLLYRDEMLDEEYWQTRAGVMIAALRSQNARQIFFNTRDAGFYTPDFAAWASAAISEAYGT